MQRDATNFEALTNGDSYCQLWPPAPPVAGGGGGGGGGGMVTYYNLDPAPGGVVTAGPAAARASFLAALTGTVTNYDFEGRTNGDAIPFSATFFNSATGLTTSLAMTTNSAKYTPAVRNVAAAGRFNTTSGGSLYLQVSSELTVKIFTLTPDRNISAFGFYATDVGDFTGVFSVRLTAVGGATTTFTVFDHSVTQIASGSLMFWGFTDKSTQYTKVEIISSGPSDTLGTFDYFGLDDLVAAVPSQVL